jgi:CBS domain-containing protein
MLRLRDIMTRDVLTVGPELSLRDAMSLFVTRHISGAPVVSNGKVVGVVSLTDLAEFSAASPGVPTERPVQAEWGEWDIPADLPEGTEPPSAFFAEMWDDSGVEVGERITEANGPEWNVLEEHTVGEVMSRDVRALPADAAVEEAADFMRSAAIHRVLVMNDGLLEGIVSTFDIAAAVADHKITKRVYVFPPPAGRQPRRP